MISSLPDSTAFLGVESSISGRRWEGLSVEQDSLALMLQQRCEVPVEVARMLARRGIKPHEVSKYLEPRIRDQIGNPMSIREFPEASLRVARAVSGKERIVLICGGTLDGMCAMAVLYLWLEAAGCPVSWKILPPEPARAHDLLRAGLKEVDGSELVVCLDCGSTSAIDGQWASRSDVLVLDSCVCLHLPRGVYAYVNPGRFDEAPGHAHFCTTGIAYLLVAAARSHLRVHGMTSPRALGLLGLVALATVASENPMIELNRAFVRQGLLELHRRHQVGLRALSDQVALGQACRADHLRSTFSPVLLAGICQDRIDLGAQLLLSRAEGQSRMLASELTDTWKDLQPGVEEVAEVAFALAAKRSLDQALVWAAGGNWPYHALPHAATVLCMRTNRPAIVVGLEEDLARGVGKSVSGIDMGTVIEHCALEGLVSTCKARRITVDIEMPVQNVTRVMKRVELLLRRQGAHLRDRHALSLDGLLHSQALSVDLVEAIERAGPFGMKSPRPRFAMPWVRIKGRKLLSNRHLALTLTDERRRDTRAFMADATNSPVGKFLLSCRRHHVHVAGTPTLYCQRGKNVPTFRIEDVASAR